jgi:hypothetical protein
MVRSIYCGDTNYSNQSLDDMIKDLEGWLSNTISHSQQPN